MPGRCHRYGPGDDGPRSVGSVPLSGAGPADRGSRPRWGSPPARENRRKQSGAALPDADGGEVESRGIADARAGVNGRHLVRRSAAGHLRRPPPPHPRRQHLPRQRPHLRHPRHHQARKTEDSRASPATAAGNLKSARRPQAQGHPAAGHLRAAAGHGVPSPPRCPGWTGYRLMPDSQPTGTPERTTCAADGSSRYRPPFEGWRQAFSAKTILACCDSQR